MIKQKDDEIDLHLTNINNLKYMNRFKENNFDDTIKVIANKIHEINKLKITDDSTPINDIDEEYDIFKEEVHNKNDNITYTQLIRDINSLPIHNASKDKLHDIKSKIFIHNIINKYRNRYINNEINKDVNNNKEFNIRTQFKWSQMNDTTSNKKYNVNVNTVGDNWLKNVDIIESKNKLRFKQIDDEYNENKKYIDNIEKNYKDQE